MDTPIRVLHVVTSMNAGGIETMLMNLYRTINRDKIQFDFLVHRDFKGFYEDEIQSLGGIIYRVSPIRLLNLRKYLKELNLFFNNHPEYKIVHSHISVLSYFNLKVAKKQKVRVRIAHSHESHNTIWNHKLFRIPIIIILKILLKKQVTDRFSCSSEAGNWLFGKNFYFHIFKNAIDANKFQFNDEVRKIIRNEFNMDDHFIIGHIGNFSKAKNYPFLINIFAAIHKKNKQVHLLLIGNNRSNPDVENQVIRFGLKNNVTFTGVRSDIPELLQSMDVFVFPSHYEGLGIALIEAQAAGLKCFISDTITEEVKVTPLVEFISLKKSHEYWADQILKNSAGYERKDMSFEIKEAGYDITASSKWLENFYLNAVKEENANIEIYVANEVS